MSLPFAGRKALVTGVSTVIGRTVAALLVQNGAVVLGIDKTIVPCENDPCIRTFQTDLCNWSPTCDLLKNVLPLNILVNIACTCEKKAFTDVTEEFYNQIFNGNVKKFINLTTIVSTDMIERKTPGTIMNICFRYKEGGLSGNSTCAAAQGAIDFFTKAAALELGVHGISINTIIPSYPSRNKDEDIANVVFYMLSEKAKCITGMCLSVDGIRK